jgi:nitrogen regulatory protein PII
MSRTTRRLVTIVTEAVLERELAKEFESVGIRGYTLTEARGRGRHGERSSDWEHSANIRIEVLCDEQAAGRLMERLRQRYFEHRAMVLFAQDVEVLRPELF